MLLGLGPYHVLCCSYLVLYWNCCSFLLERLWVVERTAPSHGWKLDFRVFECRRPCPSFGWTLQFLSRWIAQFYGIHLAVFAAAASASHGRHRGPRSGLQKSIVLVASVCPLARVVATAKLLSRRIHDLGHLSHERIRIFYLLMQRKQE